MKLKLHNLSEANQQLLDYTLHEYTSSYNRVCKAGWDNQIYDSTRIHKLTYTQERSISKLPSQLVCSAREKAKESLLLARKEGGKNAAKEILSLIQQYKGIDYSLQYAERLVHDAQSQLNIFADCAEKNQLNAVGEYVLSRNI